MFDKNENIFSFILGFFGAILTVVFILLMVQIQKYFQKNKLQPDDESTDLEVGKVTTNKVIQPCGAQKSPEVPTKTKSLNLDAKTFESEILSISITPVKITDDDENNDVVDSDDMKFVVDSDDMKFASVRYEKAQQNLAALLAELPAENNNLTGSDYSFEAPPETAFDTNETEILSSMKDLTQKLTEHLNTLAQDNSCLSCTNSEFCSESTTHLDVSYTNAQEFTDKLFQPVHDYLDNMID